MLTSAPITPTIPVTDLKKSKAFYNGKLGFKIISEMPGGIGFAAGGKTEFYVYKRGPSKADHTLASFMVKNLEKIVDELIKKGIVFEQYNYPGLKTDKKGIAVLEDEGEKGAWFKDPFGNILAIGQKIK
jgi:catechol 2,3-dioxygenase-like lactoylglutathione lyase family enzyme